MNKFKLLLTVYFSIICAFTAHAADRNPSSSQEKKDASTTVEPQLTYIPLDNEARTPILTPSLEGREVQKIQLQNNLQVYLISDPGADQSAAAMAVNTGSWDDPIEYPGMAHFLEHMLFLGTKKYPEESSFQKFTGNHGGTENAYTADDRTVYSFSIDNNAFPEALDRFAQFFIDPLFNPSGVDREAHAIDQEYAKNLQNDSWRVLFVRKALTNPEHPESRFNIGNIKTVAKISPEALRQWYENHYSANIMRLVIYSNLPINELRELIVKSFTAIPDRNLTPTNVLMPMSLPQSCGNIVYITPYKDIRHLILFWIMPASLRYDADIVAYYLGDESDKSLLTALKRGGLAEAISTSVTKFGNDIVFALDISLTENGVKDIHPVLTRTFEMIQRIKEKGVSRILFDELKKVAELKYQYQSRQNPFNMVSSDADALIDEQISTYPERTLIPQKYDPEAINKVNEHLSLTPCNIFLIAEPELTGVPTDLKEPWMGVEYTLKPLPDTLKKAIEELKDIVNLDLPPPNPFIPQHLPLVVNAAVSSVSATTIKQLPTAIEISNSPFGQYYFIPDARYKVPEIAYLFRLHSPAVRPGNALQCVLVDLYLRVVTESLKNLTYQASLANLNFTAKPLDTGIAFSIDGYSEKADEFLKDILVKMRTPSFTESEFELFKRAQQSEYENSIRGTPFEQSEELLKSVIYKNYATSNDKLEAIKNITGRDLSVFIQSFFKFTYIQGTLAGNLTENDALNLVQATNQSLGGSPYAKNDIPKREIILLPEEKGPYIVSKKIPQKGNCALLMLENGCFSFKKHAALEVLSKGIEEPFFSELRTKQQTGYLVTSLAQEVQKQLCEFFVVQSNTYDPRDLLARYELMIEGFLQNLTTTEINEHRFETLKASSISELMQPPKNVKEMATTLDALAFDYGGDFRWLDKRHEGLDQLTYQDFVHFAKYFLGKSNHRRLAILIYGEGSDLSHQYTPYKTPRPIRQQSQFFSRDELEECQSSK